MPISPEETPNPFESMSPEALRQILREDFSQSSEGNYSQEQLFQVMQALSHHCPTAKGPKEAFAIFQSDYLPEAGKGSRPGRARKSALWKAGLIAAVAAIVILVGGTLTANALQIDLWGIIGKWTQETFHFGKLGEGAPSTPPDANNTLAYSGLREALEKANISIPLVPTWIPDGYEELAVDCHDSPLQRMFNATYRNGEAYITIHITKHLSSDPITIEQGEMAAEIYKSNGIDYYIFDNIDTMQIAWVNANFECCISGHIEVSDIYRLIDSIK